MTKHETLIGNAKLEGASLRHYCIFCGGTNKRNEFEVDGYLQDEGMWITIISIKEGEILHFNKDHIFCIYKSYVKQSN